MKPGGLSKTTEFAKHKAVVQTSDIQKCLVGEKASAKRNQKRKAATKDAPKTTTERKTASPKAKSSTTVKKRNDEQQASSTLDAFLSFIDYDGVFEI